MSWGAVSLKFLGGKLAPKLVSFVLIQEAPNIVFYFTPLPRGHVIYPSRKPILYIPWLPV